MGQFVGDKDDWNKLKPRIMEITIYVTTGIIAFAIASILYLTQDSSKIVYFMIILGSLSLGLSFWAVTVSAISR